MKRFSSEQEEVICEKMELFSTLTEPGISPAEYYRRAKIIEAKIVNKRLGWYKQNHTQLKYLDNPNICDLQKAVGLVYGMYMGVYEGISIIPLEDEQGISAVHIVSGNFCPYLEAFKRLNINPKKSAELCKIVLEKPCQALIDRVDSHIKFYRNYDFIRPVHFVCLETVVQTNFFRATPQAKNSLRVHKKV